MESLLNNVLNYLLSNQLLFYGVLNGVAICIIILICCMYYKQKDYEEEVEEETSRKRALFRKVKDEAVEEIKVTKLTEDPDGDSVDLEAILDQMQFDLDHKEDVIAQFEQDQEEKAIISYQELLQAHNKENVKPVNEALETAIQTVEKSSVLDDVIYDIEETDPEPDLFDEMQVEGQRKFRNTDFISPVFGRMETNMEYPTIPPLHTRKARSKEVYDTNNLELLERTLDLDPVSDELQKNDDFLQSLKEFRRNLQ